MPMVNTSIATITSMSVVPVGFFDRMATSLENARGPRGDGHDQQATLSRRDDVVRGLRLPQPQRCTRRGGRSRDGDQPIGREAKDTHGPVAHAPAEVAAGEQLPSPR